MFGIGGKKAEAPQADASKPAPKKSIFSAEFHIFGVSNEEIAMSIRHLGLMLKSGLALGDAIQVLSEKSVESRLQTAYTDISNRIQGGMSLSESMTFHKKIFSEIVISIVSAGEQGGTLEQNLEFLADYLKKSNELTKKVKGAMMYPGIVFSLTIVEMLGVIFFILPKLEDLFSSFETPKFTRLILDGAAFFRSNAIFFFAGTVLLTIALLAFFRTKKGHYVSDYLSLKIPVMSTLTVHNTMATFSRTLNILLKTGIPIAKALEISVSTTPNAIYKKALIDIHESVKSGQTLAKSMEKYEKLFPGSFTKMVEIGETTGALEDNLFYLYDFHATQVEDISDNLTVLIEPILMVVIGGMIGFLAVIIVGPIYQFTGSITTTA